MHRDKYKDNITYELECLLNEVSDAYKNKMFLGAQRALQFGGDSLKKHNARMYNCSASYCDRTNFFTGFTYLLLSGAGVGFSVQKHHISKLPKMIKRTDDKIIYTAEDSIEGWAECVGVLLSSYFIKDQTHPDYFGKKIIFDLSNIRPKGSLISGGFLAPGPEPLRQALLKIELLLDNYLKLYEEEIDVPPIVIYDICMYIADAVISGGKNHCIKRGKLAC